MGIWRWRACSSDCNWGTAQLVSLRWQPQPTPTLLVNGKEEKFQLDSGSTVNIMADKTVKKLNGENALDDLDKPSVTLVMYKKSELNLWPTNLSRCWTQITRRSSSIEFLIVSGACKSILGLRASEHLQLLTIKNRIYLPWTAMLLSGLFKKEDCLSLYKDVFSAEGKL